MSQPLIESPSRLDEVKSLLAACRLPTEDVDEHVRFLVAREGGQLIGVAGIEQFGTAALLRSVAVHAQWRRKGIAHALCDAVMRDARQRGVQRLFLLTTDAERYFARLGFSAIERSAIPADVQATAQFREICPQSAVAMMRVL